MVDLIEEFQIEDSKKEADMERALNRVVNGYANNFIDISSYKRVEPDAALPSIEEPDAALISRVVSHFLVP
jgi:hypothetical protein